MPLLASKISKWNISAKHHSHQCRTFEISIKSSSTLEAR